MFRGSIVALITPFRAGKIDEKAFQNLVEWQIAQGTNGLVPCGTTGESPTLSHKEHMRVVELCVEVAKGRVPVIAGTGSNSTDEALRLTIAAQRSGADGALVVAPYYNKPTQEGFYHHYRALALAVELPICIYNIPGRTGKNIEPETIIRLAEFPNITMVKEATGSMDQASAVVAATDLTVLSGDDSLTLPLMAIGGRGIVSVASNETPAEMAQMVELAERNDFAAARAMHVRLMPLMSANFVESNPIPVKFALSALGLLEESYRLPLVPPRPSSRARILEALAAVNPVAVQA